MNQVESSRCSHCRTSPTYADEYAKLRDETPIDEEWASKVRADAVDMNLTGQYWCVIVWRMEPACWAPMHEARFKTRGQVRCLLLAAGIECEV